MMKIDYVTTDPESGQVIFHQVEIEPRPHLVYSPAKCQRRDDGYCGPDCHLFNLCIIRVKFRED